MNFEQLITDPFFILFVGIVIVVGGIIGLKLHPFLALLLGAFVVAWLTPFSAIEQFAIGKGMTPAAAEKMSRQSIGERIGIEFGNTAAKLGIIIAMAAIIGKCMLESGAAERIIRSLLNVLGINKAPAAFLVSSFFIGIPVFFDAVIFLMMPLAKAMSVRIGRNYILLVLSILSGAVMANSLVPPAAGPMFMVGAMQIPIGLMMVAGTILGLVTASTGYLFARWVNKRMVVPVRDSLDARLEDIKLHNLKADAELPSFWFSVLPVLLPLLLICADTFIKMSSTGTTILEKTIRFLGDKNIALIIAALVALLLVVSQRKNRKTDLSSFVQAALMSGGGIILITCAGGAFGGMLQQTGISNKIANLTAHYQMALIPLSFLVAAIIRTAQGSATVSVITTSGILAGLASHTHLEYNLVYIGLAIGCGSKLVPWMNDAGFWVVCKVSNLTEKEALKTLSPLNTIMGIVGLIVILIAAKLFPMI